MKTAYTIVRYENGWTVDSKTGDSISDYSAVFEDPEWEEDVRASSAYSLVDLIWNTFDSLMLGNDVSGIDINYIDTNEQETDSAEEQEASAPEENEDE